MDRAAELDNMSRLIPTLRQLVRGPLPTVPILGPRRVPQPLPIAARNILITQELDRHRRPGRRTPHRNQIPKTVMYRFPSLLPRGPIVLARQVLVPGPP